MDDVKSLIEEIEEIKEMTENEKNYFYDTGSAIAYIKHEADDGYLELSRIKSYVYGDDEDRFIIDVTGKVLYININAGEIKEIKEFKFLG